MDCRLLPEYKLDDVGDIKTLSQIYPQNVRDLEIPKVWAKTKGRGVVVAVLDTGCPVNHPDLIPNIDLSKCRSFVDGEDIFDTHVGHSTHCSGTIGAVDNTEGIVGIAPEVTIITVKVLDKNGSNRGDSVERGLEYCLKIKPDVVNLSLGGPNPMSTTHSLIKRLVAANIPVVCSAGNNGTENVLYPARYEECIAVGSYSNSLIKDRSLFSSWGESLDIMAPGEQILSTFLNGSYAVMSGTSMAAPAVAAVIALIISYNRKQERNLTVDQIKNLLYSTAIDVKSPGKDVHYGWGIINPNPIFVTNSVHVVKKQNPIAKFFSRLANFFR